MNIPAAAFACVFSFLAVFDRNVSVVAQESEIDSIRELGLIINFERMPPKPRVARWGFGLQDPADSEGAVNGDLPERAHDISMIRSVYIPADWSGKPESLEILRMIPPRKYGRPHTLCLLAPTKLTRESFEPIATRLGWEISVSPSVYLGIGWKAKTPPFEVILVVSESPASISGITVGDTIVQIGDDGIRDYESLRIALLKYLPGDEAMLKLDRDGVELTVKLTLASLPEYFNPPEN